MKQRILKQQRKVGRMITKWGVQYWKNEKIYSLPKIIFHLFNWFSF